MPQAGDIIGNRYQIIEELRSGLFGKTYLAEDINLPNNPWCVVKQLQLRLLNTSLLPSIKERFDTEAIVLQQLGNHDQIPRLLAHFEENQDFYLVQEFIDGEDLRKEIDRQLLDETEVIFLLQDVLNILDFVHQQGVIHRDIKPSNLIRRRSDGKIVLIDFGSVKEIGTLSVNPQEQKSYTQMVGTPIYMPPEQIDGRPVYSSDIYALGRTAIYALTGRTLIELEDTQTGELRNWQELAQVSQKLTFILDKMVRPKYGERYHSAVEVLHDLQPLLKIGQTVGRRYQITRYLGEGMWGYVYLAENSLRPYQGSGVIKQLKFQTTDRSSLQQAERLFAAQVKVLERLGAHNQIPQLWDHFKENQEFYLVEEFVEGQDLTQAEITPGKRWSEEAVISLLQQVLEILAFVHQQGVIHRNIKPSNLIRRHSDGKLVLIDFGAVKEITSLMAISDHKGTRSLTVSIGTPGYMPIEQQKGSPRFSSDIYSLGIIAIQALTGVHPDQLPKDSETGEIVWRSQAPDCHRLSEILDKMVRSNFRKRYQTASEVLVDLQKLISTRLMFAKDD